MFISILFFNRDSSGYQSSPHSDVEDVTAHRAGHSHVPQAFTRHNHTGNEVGDGRPRSQDSQAHNLLWNANCLTNLQGGNQSSEWIEAKEMEKYLDVFVNMTDSGHNLSLTFRMYSLVQRAWNGIKKSFNIWIHVYSSLHHLFLKLLCACVHYKGGNL